jgi:hypothetical protein
MPTYELYADSYNTYAVEIFNGRILRARALNEYQEWTPNQGSTQGDFAEFIDQEDGMETQAQAEQLQS